MEFKPFDKLSRLKRNILITEKIDGTNGLVAVSECGTWLKVGSRNRWITPEDDNFGFAKWVMENRDELLKLGPGYHYGEWWGAGIQRGYGLTEKRFSLFNASRWGAHNPNTPACVSVVPVLYEGLDWSMVDRSLMDLTTSGSRAAPGWAKPEGVVVYHSASRGLFKVTVEHDGVPKSLVDAAAA